MIYRKKKHSEYLENTCTIIVLMLGSGWYWQQIKVVGLFNQIDLLKKSVCFFSKSCLKRAYSESCWSLKQYILWYVKTIHKMIRAAAIYCDAQILGYGHWQYAVLYWRRLICCIAVSLQYAALKMFYNFLYNLILNCKKCVFYNTCSCKKRFLNRNIFLHWSVDKIHIFRHELSTDLYNCSTAPANIRLSGFLFSLNEWHFSIFSITRHRKSSRFEHGWAEIICNWPWPRIHVQQISAYFSAWCFLSDRIYMCPVTRKPVFGV